MQYSAWLQATTASGSLFSSRAFSRGRPGGRGVSVGRALRHHRRRHHGFEHRVSPRAERREGCAGSRALEASVRHHLARRGARERASTERELHAVYPLQRGSGAPGRGRARTRRPALGAGISRVGPRDRRRHHAARGGNRLRGTPSQERGLLHRPRRFSFPLHCRISSSSSTCRATGRRASPIRCATTCSGRRPRSSRTGTWSCPKLQGSAQTSTRTSWTTTAWHEVGLRMRTGTPKTHVPGGGRYLQRRYPLHAPQHASSRSERNRRISTLAASEATFAAWKPHSVPTTRGLHWKRSDVMGRFRCTPPTSES